MAVNIFKFLKLSAFFLLFLIPSILKAQNNPWHPVAGPLTTPWTKDVNPRQVHQEYPRPQLERKEWQNLNGLWDYQITSDLKNTPESLKNADGKILVPFPIESSLSGVKKALLPDQKLWYSRTFTVPASWEGKKILLHFGASDWVTNVWVNGQKAGTHQGGYTAFSFDISGALIPDQKEQTLVVSVWDPTDKGFQPIGKQTLDPRGIWYTSTSGIWQTVWMEPVAPDYIQNLVMTPDIDHSELQLEVLTSDPSSDYQVKTITSLKGQKIAENTLSSNQSGHIAIKDAQLWSPENPTLYDIEVSLYKNGEKVDEVRSYFGMRKISLGKDQAGITRLFLNNKPVFQYGPLDQGFWPDGIYTAPTDEALKFDIQKTKDWGFNMIRKHVKVEPDRWYYYCDKIGLLVWQDMPSGDKHISPEDPDIVRVAQSAHNYREEFQELIDQLYNHPSIVTWVPFNEGWGQFDTKAITQMVRELDPSRLVNATTGWADRKAGDMHDRHDYPGPGMFPIENDGRASVLGEFGGQALVVKDHLWLTDFSKAPSHYKTSTSEEALHTRYAEMMKKLRDLKHQGLSAAVYTQTTDVETEVNGLMTYDRKVIKFDDNKLKEMNQEVINN